MTFETDVKASCWQILLLDFLLPLSLPTDFSKAIMVALHGDKDAKIFKVTNPQYKMVHLPNAKQILKFSMLVA